MKNVLGALVVLVVCTSMASALTIDNFNSGSVNDTRTNVGTNGQIVEPALPATDVIGGVRKTTLTVITDPGTGIGSTVQINVGASGILDYANAPNWDSNVHLVYDGMSGSPVDLSADDSFEWDVIFSDLNTTLTITVTDNDSSDSQSKLLPAGSNYSTAIPFASFSGIDFSQVDTITMDVDGPLGFDVQLDSFQTTKDVPEPATMGLLGLAATGLFGYIRKRRVA